MEGMSNIKSVAVPLKLKDGKMESLTTEESERLKELEGVIDNGSRSAGEALKKIRDSRLYRAEHGTFEKYCRARREFSRQYAYRLIAFAEACQLEVDTAKLTESQFHRSKTAKKDVTKRKAGEAAKRAKSTLELERKTVVSLDEEFDSFSRFLTRLDGGLSTDDYLQLLARMRDQLDRMYEAKEGEKAVGPRIFYDNRRNRGGDDQHQPKPGREKTERFFWAHDQMLLDVQQRKQQREMQ